MVAFRSTHANEREDFFRWELELSSGEYVLIMSGPSRTVSLLPILSAEAQRQVKPGSLMRAWQPLCSSFQSEFEEHLLVRGLDPLAATLLTSELVAAVRELTVISHDRAPDFSEGKAK